MNKWLLCFVAMAGLGCGSPGAPQAPSLHLPRLVSDLRGARKGATVTLNWTQPRESTDGEPLRHHLGGTRVCRAISSGGGVPPMPSCAQLLSTLPPDLTAPHKSEPGKRPAEITLQFTGSVAADLQSPAGFAQYALEVTNQSGRSAGLSNQITVSLAPTLPPPAEVKAQVRADGIYIEATPAVGGALAAAPVLQFAYRIRRREVSSPALTPIAELPAGAEVRAVDRNFEWEKSYQYTITPVTRVLSPQGGARAAEVEGDDSPPLRVFAHDIFPPAAPAGVQAVFSGSPEHLFVDVTWEPNAENDLAGYNVYRREAGGEVARVTPALVTTPYFRDSQVGAGKTYYYSASAVDLRGNESARSQESSELVPAR